MQPESSVFRVGVGGLKPGDHRDFTMSGPIQVLVDGGRVEGDVEVTVRVSATADTLVGTGTGKFLATLICHRCLIEWDEERSIDVMQIYEHWSYEDGRRIEDDGTIDLEPAVRDEVVLEIPLAPLCRSDCKGLCSECGTDLNTDPCSGHTDESDHPLAALRQLLDPQDT